MFSVVFPGQGSQLIGMGNELFKRYQLVKDLFEKANETLNYDLSKLILEGPKSDLDLTTNTQPAIFLVSYCIFSVIKKEYNIDLNKAKFFAGHSLGEYSALACAEYLSFSDTIKTLKFRGESMQNSVPKGEGGMLAVLGTSVENIENILDENKKNFFLQIANDNSDGQIVVSGRIDDLNKMMELLKTKSIKNIKLPVSAPFHCSLMQNATKLMSDKINDLNFLNGKNKLVSNVSAQEVSDPVQIKDLLIKQIESRVRWRESMLYMINNNITKFIEIGPGKVLSGLLKRINKNVESISVNSDEDIKNLDIKL